MGGGGSPEGEGAASVLQETDRKERPTVEEKT